MTVTATVGTDPDTCAASNNLRVFDGQTVTAYFCYTVTNTGSVTLDTHSLSDRAFGIILDDFEFELAPGASVDTVAAGIPLAIELSTGLNNIGTWTAYAGGELASTRSASASVTFVSPRQYGAAAGTFVGNGNEPTVAAFEGNVLMIGARNLDGATITETIDVTITVPGFAPFVYRFDPFFTLDGVVALLVRDFPRDGVPSTLTLAGLEMPLEVVTAERLPGVVPSAAVGGDIVFEFPTTTFVRSVDASRRLTVPTVTDVAPVYGVAASVQPLVMPAPDGLEVTFETTPDTNVAYLIEAYGRDPAGHAGAALAIGSPAVVALSGPLQFGDGYAIDILALGADAGFDLFEQPGQIDMAEYLFVDDVDTLVGGPE